MDKNYKENENMLMVNIKSTLTSDLKLLKYHKNPVDLIKFKQKY